MNGNERRYENDLPDNHLPGTLFTFLYCLLASGLLLNMPLVGGALYLSARVVTALIPMLRKPMRTMMRRVERRACVAALAVTLLILLTLLSAIPGAYQSPAIWPMAAVVALCMLHAQAARTMAAQAGTGRRGKLSCVVRLLALTVLTSAPLFFIAPMPGAWQLAVGFGMNAALDGYYLLRGAREAKMDGAASDGAAETNGTPRAALDTANAIRAYQRMRQLIAGALQVTFILIYTYIGARDEQPLVLLLVVLGCTALASEGARAIMRRLGRRDSDPAYIVLGGLLVWWMGLTLFTQRYEYAVLPFLSLGLSTCGAMVCITVMRLLDSDMQAVVEFVTGAPPDPNARALSAVRAECASALGQVVALLGIFALMYLDGAVTADTLFSGGVSLYLLVPALTLLFCIALSALQFPLTRRYLRKLRRWLSVRGEGENEPLEKDLESAVIARKRRHTGMRVLLFMVRPLYYHRILHIERVPQGGAPIIFLCNHGELYGPIVTNLYVPFDFRPWVISEMTEPEQVTQYMLTAMINLKLVPCFLQKPLARALTPVVLWIMRSIECIPVYRTTPRALVGTMRSTVAAMMAGDNILLFPESAGEGALESHYRREGVGPFHNGFVTLGDMYATRTGKCVCYVPMYANRQMRTLTFGNPVYHQIGGPVAAEKQRVCDAVRGEMIRIYEEQKSKAGGKKHHES